jgi:hypothetical protein
MVSGREHGPKAKEAAMHPVIMQDLASEHVKDMLATATVARRARRARRARHGSPAAAVSSRSVRYGASVRHA